MTDHPLLFRDFSVRAMLDGRKYQTRRPAWGKRYSIAESNGGSATEVEIAEAKGYFSEHGADGRWHFAKPTHAQRIKAGDLVWVKEAWAPEQYDAAAATPADIEASSTKPAYRASWDREPAYIWRSAMMMPRWASRLTLVVTGVKIERLQDISREDAIAEGMPASRGDTVTDPIEEYANLYERIHGDRAWEANPEVVAITFTAQLGNIDYIKKREAA